VKATCQYFKGSAFRIVAEVGANAEAHAMQLLHEQ
jgi:hypothetical protein